jgi:hypothetical protein
VASGWWSPAYGRPSDGPQLTIYEAKPFVSGDVGEARRELKADAAASRARRAGEEVRKRVVSGAGR